MKNSIFTKLTIVFLVISNISAQEALKSTEEDYYDFLALQGITERPTLNYRTLSDSQWNLPQDANHVWSDNNLGTTFTLWQKENPGENWFLKGINQNLLMKVYGPKWFNSFNTASPYGQNDGALWQGKGYNTSLTAGIRFEFYGIEATIKPNVNFSQNLGFEYIKPNYAAYDQNGNPTIYNGKASDFGYYGVSYIDAPQRFGTNSFWTFDWGDTEIRYSLYNFTIGFGTQSVWLGPAKLNPIIHSNNAASYPKLDFGFRKTSLYMPVLGWHLGDIEVRTWWGKLSESDYFDNNEENNDNLISAVSAAWSLPYIFNGLTIGFNRTMLSKWDNINPYTLFEVLIPGMKSSAGSDESDQRFSLIFDYHLQKVGFNIYFEWARNDFSPYMDFVVRYPFHTQGWTLGLQQAFNLPKELKLQLLLEVTFLECSADYDRLINWYTTFYAHHKITQGYTNKGQWLGAGIGTGGNSQYLGFRLYHKKGSVDIFAHRRNPDLDYTMFIDSRNNPKETTNAAEGNIRCLLDFGLSSKYYVTKDFVLELKYIFSDERNPLNKSQEGSRSSVHRFNNHIELSIEYKI